MNEAFEILVLFELGPINIAPAFKARLLSNVVFTILPSDPNQSIAPPRPVDTLFPLNIELLTVQLLLFSLT